MRTLVKWTIIVLSVIWIISLLIKDYQQIGWIITQSSLFFILISILVGTVSLAHNALIFYLLINNKQATGIAIPTTCALYFNSQIIRHLPGRIWGVVYQLTHAAMEQTSKASIIRANIEHSLLSLTSSGLFFFLFIYFRSAPNIVVVSILSYYAAAYFLWTSKSPATLASSFLRKLKLRRVSEQITFEPLTPTTATGILLANFSSWLFYIVAWYYLLGSYIDFNINQSTLVLASYSGAWVVGFLSLITPSGIGIRESSFIFFSSGLDSPERIVFFAIIARIWLIIIDLNLVFISFLWANYYARKTTTV